MEIPPQAWAPLGAVMVALVGVLGALLVRERRRNSHGNPGNHPTHCLLADESWRGRWKGMAEEMKGVRNGEGKVLDKLDDIFTTLVVIKDRLARQSGGDE